MKSNVWGLPQVNLSKNAGNCLKLKSQFGLWQGWYAGLPRYVLQMKMLEIFIEHLKISGDDYNPPPPSPVLCNTRNRSKCVHYGTLKIEKHKGINLIIDLALQRRKVQKRLYRIASEFSSESICPVFKKKKITTK